MLLALALVAAVLGAQPALQWTPVLLPPSVGVSYHVKVVRRELQQSPATALASNPAWLDTQVDGVPMLLYPNDALPLEPDAEHVWRVEVLDGDGRPVTRGGKGSEIWTFRVGGPSRGNPLAAGVPDTLILITGVARLTGLHRVEVESTPLGYSRNGRVGLELEAPFQATLRVDAQDLEIDRNALASGVSLIRSWQREGSLPAGAVPAGTGSPFLAHTRSIYTAGGGLGLFACDFGCWSVAATVPGAGVVSAYVAIAPGATTAEVTLNGLALGPTTLRANASGYAEDTLSVQLSDQVVARASVLLALGTNTTCLIRSGGALYCWGLTAYGAVGDGTTTQRLMPTAQVPCLTILGGTS